MEGRGRKGRRWREGEGKGEGGEGMHPLGFSKVGAYDSTRSFADDQISPAMQSSSVRTCCIQELRRRPGGRFQVGVGRSPCATSTLCGVQWVPVCPLKDGRCVPAERVSISNDEWKIGSFVCSLTESSISDEVVPHDLQLRRCAFTWNACRRFSSVFHTALSLISTEEVTGPRKHIDETSCSYWVFYVFRAHQGSCSFSHPGVTGHARVA